MSSTLFRKYINNNENLECQKFLTKVMIFGLTGMTVVGSCVILTENFKTEVCTTSKNVKHKFKYPAFKPIPRSNINSNTQNNTN